jgi:O-antigen/teichoic acid export membrane protein
MDSSLSIWQRLKALPRSGLYANSAYLIAANAVNAGFGFLFWTAAARLHRADEVGLAAGAVSV